MERSKRIVGVHKGSEFDSGSQWDRIRLLSTEQVMELSDHIEDSSGYVSTKSIAKPKHGRRSLFSSVGSKARLSED